MFHSPAPLVAEAYLVLGMPWAFLTDCAIKALIYQNKVNYPIHIKLETGMKRLGFDREMLPALIQKLATQPEIKIESIYSHLADSDNPQSTFVHQQFDTYLSLAGEIEKHLSYPVLHHLLNSEGCVNFSYHFWVCNWRKILCCSFWNFYRLNYRIDQSCQ